MEAQTSKKYALNLDIKFKYITLVLINEIVNYQKYFSVAADGDNMFLDEYLKYMHSHGLLEVKDDKYIPTQKGREYLVNFFAKYFEFLKVFDIYCAVDLGKGEFAFASMFNDDMDDDQWKEFLVQERFSDVRVAVAELKGINPIEIVFMSFLNEGRFDTSSNGWQIYLTKDGVWNEIIDICNTAISLEYLKENDVIQDVVKQGSELMLQLYKQEEERNARLDEIIEEDGEDVIEETVVVEEYVDIVEPPYYAYDYYEPYYYDPFYISPIWLIPFIL